MTLRLIALVTLLSLAAPAVAADSAPRLAASANAETMTSAPRFSSKWPHCFRSLSVVGQAALNDSRVSARPN
jgi:hypothetical protein